MNACNLMYLQKQGTEVQFQICQIWQNCLSWKPRIPLIKLEKEADVQSQFHCKYVLKFNRSILRVEFLVNFTLCGLDEQKGNPVGSEYQVGVIGLRIFHVLWDINLSFVTILFHLNPHYFFKK